MCRSRLSQKDELAGKKTGVDEKGVFLQEKKTIFHMWNKRWAT